MLKHTLWGIALAGLLLAGCKSARLEKTGEVRPAPQAAAAAPAPTSATPVAPAAASPAAAAPAAGRGYEILQLTAVIPQETMDAAEQQATCPRTFLIALFGADFANPHGCVIGRLAPDGLAAKAGLAVGDSIVSCNGTEVTCPSTLLPEVQQSFEGSEPGKVVLVIHRRLPAATTK